MRLHFVLPVLAGVVFVAACAGVDDSNTAAKAKPEYITGSRIPIKDALPPVSDAEREQTIEKVRRMQRSDASASKTGTPQ